MFFAAWMTSNVSWRLGYSLFGSMLLDGYPKDAFSYVPHSAGALLGFFIAMAVNAFAEELAMRGDPSPASGSSARRPGRPS